MPGEQVEIAEDDTLLERGAGQVPSVASGREAQPTLRRCSEALNALQDRCWAHIGAAIREDSNEPAGDSVRHMQRLLRFDLESIAHKLLCVLFPSIIFPRRGARLDAPDFWGPALCVTLYSFLLYWGAADVFTWVWTIWIGGSAIVAAVARALGGSASFFLILGVTGFSTVPLAVVCALLAILPAWTPGLVAFGIKAAGVAWASASAGTLLRARNLQRRRVLVLYPIVLLNVYFVSLRSGL